MSKKVLKPAVRRPMLLALIMATAILGLLFSGWLTPTPSKAQPSQQNAQPNVETTNCVTASTSSSCVTAGSISLVAPTNSPVVCMGSGVSLSASYLVTTGQVQVTTTYTNSGNSGSGACPDTYTTNYPTPTIVSNWWEASVGSYSTNGKGLSASFTPTDCGSGAVTFHLTYKNSDPCDTNVQSAGDVTGSFNVVQILYQCLATTPTNQFRTTIGVGEEVALEACGAPGNVTWSTSAGTLSPTNGAITTLTAPDRKATATVTVYYDGGSCSLPFNVIEPSGVYFATNALKHHYDRADIGFYALTYLKPDSVNFSHVWCIEEKANCVADGVYLQWDGYPHDRNPSPFSFGDAVVPSLGTGPANDTCYSGETDSSIAMPFSPGTEKVTIPWDFCVNSGPWKTNFTTLTWNCSESDGGDHGEGLLKASKSNAKWSCNVDDPDIIGF
jgi:hypothetical protein